MTAKDCFEELVLLQSKIRRMMLANIKDYEVNDLASALHYINKALEKLDGLQ